MQTRKGILITFSIKTDKFKSNYERTTFFKKLYGWKQVVPNEDRKYEYERPGILDEIPHEKVGQSSFIVPENHVGEIMDFFEEWHSKVMWKTFKVLLDRDMERLFRNMEKMLEEEVEE